MLQCRQREVRSGRKMQTERHSQKHRTREIETDSQPEREPEIKRKSEEERKKTDRHPNCDRQTALALRKFKVQIPKDSIAYQHETD